MSDSHPDFDAARICRETVVRQVRWYEELPSTSDLALQQAATALADDLPLLVLASRQTGGRGRGPHRWWAAAGALTFSLVLDTAALELAPQRWPRVSLATGIAVAQTVRDQLSASNAMPGRGQVQVKWPNDVFVGERKICGILAENVPQHPQRLVIGIGLNVNNSWRQAPEDLQGVGTSLCDLADQPFSAETILIDLLQRLQQTLLAVAADTFPLTETWRELCMLQGCTVTVESGNQLTSGVCQGIDDDGALLLQSEGGIQRCLAGSIARIH